MDYVNTHILMDLLWIEGFEVPKRHHLVLLLKVVHSYCPPVPIVDSTEFISTL